MAKDERGERPPERPSGGLSRRDFLRGSAVAGLAPGILGAGAAAAQEDAPREVSGVQVWGPGPVPVTLRINGKPHKLRLEPRVTLLDAMRDHVDLTGAKRVCDRGTCGACTVHLDGRPVYACSILAVEAQGHDIATIEGLSDGSSLHPLEAAFVDNDAQQCGFCTPGFVMASKALLDANPSPTVEEIHRGLSGNFCRCGTYAGLRKAVAQAAGKGKRHG